MVAYAYAYAWAGFDAAFGPVVLFSLFWKRMTRLGALAGMLVGALAVVLWPMTGSARYEMVPGVAFAAIAIMLASLLDRPPLPHIQATHEAVQAELRATGY